MASHDPVSPQKVALIEPFFGLSAAALEAVARSARTRRIAAGARIFSQGDDGVRAHAVIEGLVRISQTGGDGAQVVVRFVGPGEMFGTVGLFTDGRYPAEATALSDVFEASWSGPEFSDLVTRCPQIANNLIRVLGTRLQEVQDRTRELATQGAEQRVAQVLLRLLRHAREVTQTGITLPFPLRRKDVADVAGTTLYTASRILSGWQKAGLLTTSSRYLTVRNAGELRRIAER